MGASFISTALKSKTSDKIRKEFAEMVEDANHDYGHNGYTGTWNTMTLSITGRTFNTFEEAYDRMSEVGDKGVAYAVQVKVVKLGKRYETLTKQINDITHQLIYSVQDLPTRSRNALDRKRMALTQKRKDMLDEAGAKSTKTSWALMGWARS